MFKLTQHFGIDIIDNFEFSSPSIVIGKVPDNKKNFTATDPGNSIRAIYDSYESFKPATEKIWRNLAIFYAESFNPLEKLYDSTKNELHFVIYCGQRDFIKLVLSLWKTAFPNATSDDLYQLYTMYYTFAKSSNGWIEIPNDKEIKLYSMTYKEFLPYYYGTEKIRCSREEIAAIIPIEYLLSSWLNNPTDPLITKYLHKNLKFDFEYLFFVECRDVFNHAKENLCNWSRFFFREKITNHLEDQISLSTFPKEMIDEIGETNIKLILEYPFGYGVKNREFARDLRNNLDVKKLAQFLLDWATRRREVTLVKAWEEDMTSRTSYPTDIMAKFDFDDFDTIMQGIFNTEYWEELCWKRHNFFPQIMRIIENKNNPDFLKRWSI